MSDNKEFIEEVGKEIDSFPLINNIPGGRDYLVNFVYDKLLKVHSLAKTDHGLELRDKEDPTQAALIDDESFTLKSFLVEVLSDFIDRAEVERKKREELAVLEKGQKEAIDRRKKERLEATRTENYQVKSKYDNASAKNKQVLKALGIE